MDNLFNLVDNFFNGKKYVRRINNDSNGIKVIFDSGLVMSVLEKDNVVIYFNDIYYNDFEEQDVIFFYETLEKQGYIYFYKDNGNKKITLTDNDNLLDKVKVNLINE